MNDISTSPGTAVIDSLYRKILWRMLPLIVMAYVVWRCIHWPCFSGASMILSGALMAGKLKHLVPGTVKSAPIATQA